MTFKDNTIQNNPDENIQFSPMNMIAVLNVSYTLTFCAFYIFHILSWTDNTNASAYDFDFNSIFLCFSVFFIILSGASFRINNAMRNGAAGFVLLVMLACSIKSMILYGGYQFYKWEAPHTIALSILILQALNRMSIFLNYALFAILIFSKTLLFNLINPPLKKLLNHSYMFSAATDTYLIKSSIIVLFALSLYSIVSKFNIRNRLKISLAITTLIISALWLSSKNNYSVFEINLFKSLPYGILIGDAKFSNHIFGLITWLPIVLAGYLLTDLILLIKNRLKIHFALLCFSVFTLIFLIYNFTQLTRFQSYFRIVNLGNEFMMDPAHSNVLLFSSIYLILFYTFIFFSTEIKKIKFFKIIAQSTFYQYIFLTLFGNAICGVITSLLPKYNFEAAVFVLISLGVGLAYLIDYLTSFKFEFILRTGAKPPNHSE